MSRLLFAGLFTEGDTDVRVLKPVVEKTLTEIAFECKGETELEVRTIQIEKTDPKFVEQVLKASKTGVEQFGIMLLCVHTDADGATNQHIWKNKIVPAKEALDKMNKQEYCKTLAALVPIQMTEAWMLADTELLKKQIGTQASDADLGLSTNPEKIGNPKKLIEEIIRKSEASKTKRRRRKELKINDLYQIIGQSLDIQKLEPLEAFQHFKKELRTALKELNFL